MQFFARKTCDTGGHRNDTCVACPRLIENEDHVALYPKNVGETAPKTSGLESHVPCGFGMMWRETPGTGSTDRSRRILDGQNNYTVFPKNPRTKKTHEAKCGIPKMEYRKKPHLFSGLT
jgi:hypothetical protein